MASALKHVYCFQVGLGDCYKIGLTKNEPEKRMRAVKTGSPLRFTLCRVEQTHYPRALEKHIHGLLSAKRAENGEFFFATKQEIDTAFDEGVAFVAEFQPLIEAANRFKEQRPKDELAEPTDDTREAYRQLKVARRELLLLEQRIKFLESKIQVAIGDNAGIAGIASWGWVDNWQLDAAAFRENEPEEFDLLFAKYNRNAGGRRFCLEKGNLTRGA